MGSRWCATCKDDFESDLWKLSMTWRSVTPHWTVARAKNIFTPIWRSNRSLFEEFARSPHICNKVMKGYYAIFVGGWNTKIITAIWRDNRSLCEELARSPHICNKLMKEYYAILTGDSSQKVCYSYIMRVIRVYLSSSLVYYSKISHLRRIIHSTFGLVHRSPHICNTAPV